VASSAEQSVRKARAATATSRVFRIAARRVAAHVGDRYRPLGATCAEGGGCDPPARGSAVKPVVLHEQDVPLESWNEESRSHVEWRTLVSGDRTPTEALTLGVAELPPGRRSDLVTHRHDTIEAYYVLTGEGIVSIDGVEHPVRAGSVAFLPGDVEHGALNTGTETMRLLYVFAADSFEEVEYRFSQPRSDG
jgi:quercetin dioxygenase-like cupin family protein